MPTIVAANKYAFTQIHFTEIGNWIVVIKTHCPEYSIKLNAFNLLRNTTYLTSHADIFSPKMNTQKSNYKEGGKGGREKPFIL